MTPSARAVAASGMEVALVMATALRPKRSVRGRVGKQVQNTHSFNAGNDADNSSGPSCLLYVCTL